MSANCWLFACGGTLSDGSLDAPFARTYRLFAQPAQSAGVTSRPEIGGQVTAGTSGLWLRPNLPPCL